jgi:hypothetical protein
MMSEKKRNLAAACGLYCGACSVYHAKKRGDSEFFKQLADKLVEAYSGLEEGQVPPGWPPPVKDYDIARVQKEMQRGISTDCEGCLSEVLGFTCQNCGFRECAQEKGLTNCSQCPDSPCQRLIDFNNDIFPHHGEVLGNIRRQKEIGVDAWLVEQEEKWRCSQCGVSLAWYDEQCPDCGASLSQTFGSFPL